MGFPAPAKVKHLTISHPILNRGGSDRRTLAANEDIERNEKSQI
jgi:hypothetical protein